MGLEAAESSTTRDYAHLFLPHKDLDFLCIKGFAIAILFERGYLKMLSKKLKGERRGDTTSNAAHPAPLGTKITSPSCT